MPRSLALGLWLTDLAFLIYWVGSGAVVLGLAPVLRTLMYAHFDQPDVVAWNWSFLPVDVAFSVLGLSAVEADRRGSVLWRPLAILSLAFTVAAGAMAVGYWTLQAQFEPLWFLPNLLLVVWPLAFLPRLVTAEPRGVKA